MTTGTDRREAQRYRVDLRAALRAYGRPEADVWMRDISAGGAMIAIADNAIERGEEVLLDLGIAQCVATVAWATDGYLGLAFHRPLRRSDIEAIRKRNGAGR